MKKIFLFFVFVAVALTAQSQVSLKYGVKAGLNIATLTGDVDDSKSLVGGQFGVFARISVLDKLAIQPELLYSMQGVKGEGEDGNVKFENNYIQVPVMVKFYPIMGLNLQAGPQIGFLASSKFDGEDIKDYMKKVDFAMNVGAGYDFDFGLGIDARYSIGLTNVLDFTDELSGAEAKNGVFSVAVSYSF